MGEGTEFLGLNEQETRAQYGLETYLQKYNSDDKGSLNLRQHMDEFDDWVMDVPFGNGKLVRVLCCPEDRHCSSSRCLQGTTMCEECIVPICRTCKTHCTDREGPKLAPVALANGLMSFYGPEELYEEGGLTVMEMICSSPCLTFRILSSNYNAFESKRLLF